METLEFSVYSIMSSTNSDSLTSSLPILAAFYFSPDVEARTSNTMLNRSGKSGHPCLVDDFREKTLSSSLWSMIVVDLS